MTCAPLQPDRLRVGGLTPFSTVDYPGRLCAVVFCQGCPWRCRYCHNPHLQPTTHGSWTWQAVEEFLKSRRGLLEAVVFSGGEPTIQVALEPAVRAVRALGFEVGLHTAGINVPRLQRVLPLVSWVGLDIKAPFDERYNAITQSKQSHLAPRAALEAVLASGVDYEVRTTVHPALLSDEDCEAINRQLAALGSKATRWQKFRAIGCQDEALNDPAGF